LPSVSVNPANQLGSRIPVTSTTGLGTGVILGKAFFKLSDKPKLSEAFMATIRFKSLIVRPFFCPNIKICTICLNNSKFCAGARFIAPPQNVGARRAFVCPFLS